MKFKVLASKDKAVSKEITGKSGHPYRIYSCQAQVEKEDGTQDAVFLKCFNEQVAATFNVGHVLDVEAETDQAGRTWYKPVKKPFTPGGGARSGGYSRPTYTAEEYKALWDYALGVVKVSAPILFGASTAPEQIQSMLATFWIGATQSGVKM